MPAGRNRGLKSSPLVKPYARILRMDGVSVQDRGHGGLDNRDIGLDNGDLEALLGWSWKRD